MPPEGMNSPQVELQRVTCPQRVALAPSLLPPSLVETGDGQMQPGLEKRPLCSRLKAVLKPGLAAVAPAGGSSSPSPHGRGPERTGG